jgi:hypothetical protein
VSLLLSNTQDSRLSCSCSLKFKFVDRFVHSKESARSRRAARDAWGLMDYRLLFIKLRVTTNQIL